MLGFIVWDVGSEFRVGILVCLGFGWFIWFLGICLFFILSIGSSVLGVCGLFVFFV